jgi:3-dehydroquinate dehydratase-2
MIGGPNLGRLGQREPEIYGRTTWAELEEICRRQAAALDLDLEFLQSDSEGEIVGMLHRAADLGQGVILNAAAYTHTSVAVRDAVSALDIPVIELHLSNPAAREPFRRQNLLADVVTAGIQGFGVEGYRMALQGMKSLLISA